MPPSQHTSANHDTGLRKEQYAECREYFKSVDQMMADIREAEAAAKRPVTIPPSPPPDRCEADEYFAKIDRMMAKIADGTIDEEEPIQTRKRTNALSSKVSGALKCLKKRSRDVMGSGHGSRSSDRPKPVEDRPPGNIGLKDRCL
ncbi:unnamed protein product [Discula destructiva]